MVQNIGEFENIEVQRIQGNLLKFLKANPRDQ